MRVTPGRFLVLVGPDGVGKTSVASRLCERLDARYFHFRPRLGEEWGVPEPGETQDKPNHSAGVVESIARIGLNFARLWVGHLVRVRPELRRGRDVVADRWAYGYLAKPSELRYFGPGWLARLLISMLPSPTMVICLTAPADVIASRKAELERAEIEEDLVRWKSLPVQRLAVVDATRDPDSVVDLICDLLA